MAERIFATGHVREQIIAELQAYRHHHADYVTAMHPQTSCVLLSHLATEQKYASLVDQPLLHRAMSLLEKHLQIYGNYELLQPSRVWVGIAMPPNDTCFGGFHHPDQGYRYLQQIAIVSLCGSLSGRPVGSTLATLELLRGYAHDTLHHNSYRLFYPLPQPEAMHFYRFQYGINFRKRTAVSYSAKDRVRSTSTRNLGNIMEAATDRFAHEFVLSLAKEIPYSPDTPHTHDLSHYLLSNPIDYYVYRDCTGQLTTDDIHSLREIEREQGKQTINATSNFQSYLKLMRLFVQYVNLRYQVFLAEFDPDRRYQLHHLIIQSMLSGKMKGLSQCIDNIQAAKRSFVRVFKSPNY